MSVSEEPTGQQPSEPPAPPPQPGATDEKTWAMLCHLLALAGLVIPLGNIIGPLVVWLVKKDQMPIVNDQGKESLNFQITVAIAMVVGFVVVSILSAIPVIGWIFAIILWIPVAAIGIYALVMVILASVKANEGGTYRYPITLRLIK